ncbi:hypothetical protein B0J18DRAFT_226298 [Chaetomium sp. MPI-SDFR-AT-0129]|nr:hypothetical protein B0J18DRAFT_226298 [Chaetomium sp. MPI-SDFR-AT-0129]
MPQLITTTNRLNHRFTVPTSTLFFTHHHSQHSIAHHNQRLRHHNLRTESTNNPSLHPFTKQTINLLHTNQPTNQSTQNQSKLNLQKKDPPVKRHPNLCCSLSLPTDANSTPTPGRLRPAGVPSKLPPLFLSWFPPSFVVSRCMKAREREREVGSVLDFREQVLSDGGDGKQNQGKGRNNQRREVGRKGNDTVQIMIQREMQLV